MGFVEVSSCCMPSWSSSARAENSAVSKTVDDSRTSRSECTVQFTVTRSRSPTTMTRGLHTQHDAIPRSDMSQTRICPRDSTMMSQNSEPNGRPASSVVSHFLLFGSFDQFDCAKYDLFDLKEIRRDGRRRTQVFASGACRGCCGGEARGRCRGTADGLAVVVVVEYLGPRRIVSSTRRALISLD